jgi:hypothetical protein
MLQKVWPSEEHTIQAERNLTHFTDGKLIKGSPDFELEW